MTAPNTSVISSTKYRSIQEIKNGAKFEGPVAKSLTKLQLPKYCELFSNLYNKAQSNCMIGDDEMAYIYCSRACDIYEYMCPKMDGRFKASKEGREFFAKLTKLMDDYEGVSDRLKRLYSNLRVAEELEVQSFSEHQQPATIRESIKPSRESIKPKEIIDLVERMNQHLLILDYRIEKNEMIRYKDVNKLSVVRLDPEQILPGCLLKTIMQSVEITDRPSLECISSFDRVVLLPDLKEANAITFSQLSRISKTRLIYEALTTYNRYTLKCAPVILEKGFKNWLMSYPCYTTQNEAFPLFTDENAEFERLLTFVDKAAAVNVFYPDLSYRSTSESKPAIKPQFDLGDSFERLPTDLTPGSTLDRPPSQAKVSQPSIDRTTKPVLSQTRETPAVQPDIQLPEIDRCKKPAQQSFAPTRDNLPPKPTIKRNDESLSAVNLNEKESNNRPIHRVPTLGGARIIDDVVGPTPMPNSSTSQSRPTIPEKSIQQPMKIKQDLLRFFNLFYEKSYSNFSQQSKSSNGAKAGFSGLVNIGNTCFMNSTLQTLFHTPKFIDLFLKKASLKFINPDNKFGTRGAISGCFSALSELYWSGKFSVIQPGIFLDTFSNFVNPSLADRKQHDAQEFQIYLLDALHEDMNKVTTRKPFEQNFTDKDLITGAEQYMSRAQMFSSSPISDILSLTSVSTLRCESCDATSVRFEGLNQISVELPSGDSANYGIRTKLSECLDQFFGTSVLDALWDCSNCKAKRKATRSTKVWTLPEILVVHMKRFSLRSGSFVKNEVDIEFDVSHCNMARYIHEKAPKQRATYQLYAIINHYGTLNSGHYTSFVRHLSSESYEWMLFDDDRCIPVRSDTPLVTKNAFMLYYHRKQ